MVRRILIALVLLSSPAHAQLRDCVTRSDTRCANCTVSGYIVVRRDRVCPFEPDGITRRRVIVRPRNGVIGTSVGGEAAYRPNPGFTGEDSFETELWYGGKRYAPRYTIIRYRVRVIDGDPANTW